MDGFEERSSKPWSGDPTVSEPVDRDASWKDFGTSMNAISFGFAATAILISMFLIMAIFEHLIKPRASFFRPQNDALESIEIGHTRTQPIQKIRNSPTSEPVTITMMVNEISWTDYHRSDEKKEY
ncbi:hypothetical protein ACMD2_01337 [Ananas comosus]|uniref:Uncharacterized protein n=1 Tax=Ananas comosus TaxID=4615 RepID=A0A199VG97_ANACO|nr:hypothetical protein ACMD2_01337 [Ananas comosus]